MLPSTVNAIQIFVRMCLSQRNEISFGVYTILAMRTFFLRAKLFLQSSIGPLKFSLIPSSPLRTTIERCAKKEFFQIRKQVKTKSVAVHRE